MNKNLEVLENWYNEIKGGQELSLFWAKALFLEMQKESDKGKQKEMKDRLILGTMHVLYTHLKDSPLLSFQAQGLDALDVIQAASELWMRYILSGKLLRASSYDSYFKGNFYHELNTSLYGKSISFVALEHSETLFIELLTKYVNVRKKYIVFSFEEFKTIVTTKNAYAIYPFFEEVYSLLEQNGLLQDFKTITEGQIRILFSGLVRYFLMPTYNPKEETSFVSRVPFKDLMNEAERELLKERVQKLFAQAFVPSVRNKRLLAESCGLSWEEDALGNSLFVETSPKACKQIAEENGLTIEGVKKYIKRSCRYIKKDLICSHELSTIQEELIRSRK